MAQIALLLGLLAAVGIQVIVLAMLPKPPARDLEGDVSMAALEGGHAHKAGVEESPGRRSLGRRTYLELPAKGLTESREEFTEA